MRLSIKIEGVQPILLKLGSVQGEIKNPEPLLKKLAVLGFKDIIGHFDAESGPTGRWASLSERTIARRRKGGKSQYSDKILQDTGMLRNSLMPGRGNTRMSGPTTLLLSTNVEYAPYHQFGTSRIKKREFMWISGVTRKEMKSEVQDYIMKKWRAS